MLKTLRQVSAAGAILAVISVGAFAQSSALSPATPLQPPTVTPMPLLPPPATNAGTSGSSSDINQTGKVSGTVTGPQAVAPDTKSPQLGSGNEK
jgi:hypothetical protein